MRKKIEDDLKAAQRKLLEKQAIHRAAREKDEKKERALQIWSRQRRIEILGGIVLDNLDDGRICNRSNIIKALDKALTLKKERALFDLERDTAPPVSSAQDSPAEIGAISPTAQIDGSVPRNVATSSEDPTTLSGATNESASQARQPSLPLILDNDLGIRLTAQDRVPEQDH